MALRIDIDQVILPEKLNKAYINLNQSNGTDNTCFPTKFSGLTFFSQQKEEVDLVLLESYHLELIKEWRSLLNDEPVQAISLNKKSNQFKLVILAILGTLYFACEGFDGITSLLGIFSLPAVLLMAFGFLFSIMSVIVFYSFDLVEISKNLGVSWYQAPKLVDIYVDQLDEMKALIFAIHKELRNFDDQDKEICLKWMYQLENQYHEIQKQSIILQKQLDRPIINTAQTTATILAALIRFGDGFFAAQPLLVAIFAAMSIPTSSTVIPVIAFSFLIGLAALSIYWYVEKPGIEKFVCRRLGIDTEKLEKLQKPGKIDHKLDEINTLKITLSMFRSAANDDRIRNRTVNVAPQTMHI